MRIKFGRIDIIFKLSLSSSHVALSRERHLDTAVHVMAYVGQKYNFRLCIENNDMLTCTHRKKNAS